MNILMIELAIVIVTSLGIMVWGLHKPVEERIFAMIVGVIINVAVSFVVCFAIINSLVLGNIFVESRKLLYSNEIVSLSRYDSIEGRFFTLGSGYINGARYYTYFISAKDGGYIEDSVRTSITTIYENAPESNRTWLEWDVKERCMPAWLSRATLQGDKTTTRTSGYRMHVPPNTIVKEFKL